MRNENNWKPSKFIKYKDTFRATKDVTKVGIGYRLIGDLQSLNYDKLIKKYASGKLIDLGCGNVALYEMYKSNVNSIICSDWSNNLHGLFHVDFLMDLNKCFPIKDGLFNTIILTDVLEHVSNPDVTWKEVNRILSPKGKVIVGVPFFHPLHEEPYDFYRYTEFRLKMFCEKNNLKVLELFPYGGSLEVFFDFLSKHFSKSVLLSKFNYIFATLLIKSFIGKKIFKLTSSKYPLGYCLVAEKIK